jgi:hypothetical protein
MEQMIALQEKAERDKPPIDWAKVNVQLRAAKKQTEHDSKEAALAAAEKDGVAAAIKQALILLPQAPILTALKPKAINTEPTPIDELGVVTSIALASLPDDERPPPRHVKTPLMEEKIEPPIMKFLRSVANADDEEIIRKLAQRIILKIETLTNLKPPSTSVLTEG